MTETVRPENVTWVLTVPVCCSEPAKHFMRQAAIQAGFITGGADDEVIYSMQIHAVYRTFDEKRSRDPAALETGQYYCCSVRESSVFCLVCCSCRNGLVGSHAPQLKGRIKVAPIGRHAWNAPRLAAVALNTVGWNVSRHRVAACMNAACMNAAWRPTANVHHPNQALVLCMEPIAACLALGDRLSWKMNDKYLVRASSSIHCRVLTTHTIWSEL